MACPCSLRKSPKFASQTSSLEFDYLASHWITMDHHWISLDLIGSHWISLDLIEPHWMIQSEFHWIALDSTSTLNHLLGYPMKLSWTIYRNGIPLRPTMRLIMRLLPCTMLSSCHLPDALVRSIYSVYFFRSGSRLAYLIADLHSDRC